MIVLLAVVLGFLGLYHVGLGLYAILMGLLMLGDNAQQALRGTGIYAPDCDLDCCDDE